jgi:hypothetical protein
MKNCYPILKSLLTVLIIIFIYVFSAIFGIVFAGIIILFSIKIVGLIFGISPLLHIFTTLKKL